ncbi:MAG: fumarylacetoacetate hydrolase family protein [Dehalococcoidales bacterium]|jgi:acylpyruvate hydrolase|nr:fumarylacetoacetate hydrolase family protein [Dehalococcoidales bacterium]
MRLVTYEPTPSRDRLGVLISDKVVDLALARDACEKDTRTDIPILPSDMMSFLNEGDTAIRAAGTVAEWCQRQLKKIGKVSMTSSTLLSHDLKKIQLRAPVPRPSKILCLALNYQAHAAEGGNPDLPEKPYVFIKPGIHPVVGPGDKVFKVPESDNFIFEGELAVVIGKCCHHVPADKAYDVITGYTIVNDMSARDLGKTIRPGMVDWFRVKAFDSSLPMGPCLTTKDEIEDPHNLRLVVRVNGQTTQDAFTSEMFHKIPQVIEFITHYITLDPGDIIATGTPGGSKDALKVGDKVEVEIEKIGALASVIAERPE